MLLALSGFMLLPGFLALALPAQGGAGGGTGGGAGSFFASAVLTAAIAVSLILATRENLTRLSARQAFLFAAFSWLALASFAALPFYVGAPNLSYGDAFFESMSGLTTTGATILQGLDRLPHAVLLWRALLQWIGGIGIIVTALAVLPMLQIGGMQLFRMESSDNSEKILPRAREIAGNIALIYALLSTLCALAYGLAGLNPFDAITHAMTTIATGGFSTHDHSFAAFSHPSAELVAIFFMLAGSMPFVLYMQAMRGRPGPFWHDEQVRWLLGLVFAASLTLTLILVFRDYALDDALRLGTFNAVSIITGTGYASADFSLWGPLATALFFALMFTGGCAGSTACGIKIFRLIIAWRLVHAQLEKTAAPRAFRPAIYNGAPLPAPARASVMNFLFLYIAVWFAASALLGMAGLDRVSAFSAAAAALGNIGPGLGPQIGPAGSYASLSMPVKSLLAMLMLAGRLELFTLFVLMSPGFWRRR